MSVLVMRAMNYARAAHINQFRSDGKTPYLEHCKKVAMLVEFGGGSEEAVAAALLHDVMEDCDVSYAELVDKFSEEVASLVGELTFPAGTLNRKRLQVEAVKGMTPNARLIKLADIVANLHDIPGSEWQLERKVRYVEHLLHMRQALSGSNTRLEEGFDEIAPSVLDYLLTESLRVQPDGVQQEKVTRPSEGGV